MKINMKNDLGKNIMNKIINEEIKPMPRFNFLFKNYILWTASFFSLFIGILAVSIIIFIIRNQDWDIYTRFTETPLQYFFIVMPYFWLLVAILFTILMYYNLKHTKFGYRISLYLVVLVYFGASIILGAVAYTAGLGAVVESVFVKSVPLYRELNRPRFLIWADPENGRLGGEVIEILNSDIIIIDFNRQQWRVITEKLHPPIKNEIKNKIHCGDMIKILGKISGENIFIAEMIRPWAEKGMPPKVIREIKIMPRFKSNMLEMK